MIALAALVLTAAGIYGMMSGLVAERRRELGLRAAVGATAGQIIALGCGPNDPVRLVTDNNDDPVATGELIEIEGQLGVRLTRVFI